MASVAFSFRCICVISAWLWLHTATSCASAANWTAGNETAVKFGVHEVVLTGRGDVANPFDTIATVTFYPPSGEKQAKTVHAFHDGDNTWRARVYVSEAGAWRWSSRSETDKSLDSKGGGFTADESKLRGRLLIHPRNPRQWMTENGRWFLNLNDTAYFLLCTHDASGEPTPSADFSAYIRDDVAQGITSVRCFLASGSKGFILAAGTTDRHRWFDIFADEELTRFRLESLQTTDRRLQWLLDEHPDVYVQLILFPLGSRWGTDDSFWNAMRRVQKERVMKHLVARYAAFPQIFWLVANDVHYGERFPNNNAFVREVGAYFHRHDPWRHPMSAGHARRVPFFFGDEDWATYIHLEDEADLAAQKYELYHRFAKPVFLGEDRYEQDHGPVRDPVNMRYFQRRLFWCWLLSGGSTNYGGRWGTVIPYSQTGSRPWPGKNAITFTERLQGLDSVPHIRDYFGDRAIELSEFQPNHGLARDADADERTLAQQLKVMHRGEDEFLIYHPNAVADGKEARGDADRVARVRVDLRAVRGEYSVEWLRAEDGAVHAGEKVTSGDWRELAAPWKGHDCVVRLRRRP